MVCKTVSVLYNTSWETPSSQPHDALNNSGQFLPQPGKWGPPGLPHHHLTNGLSTGVSQTDLTTWKHPRGDEFSDSITNLPSDSFILIKVKEKARERKRESELDRVREKEREKLALAYR